MLCRSFSEGMIQHILLDDIDKKAFEEVLDLWCFNLEHSNAAAGASDGEQWW